MFSSHKNRSKSTKKWIQEPNDITGVPGEHKSECVIILTSVASMVSMQVYVKNTLRFGLLISIVVCCQTWTSKMQYTLSLSFLYTSSPISVAIIHIFHLFANGLLRFPLHVAVRFFVLIVAIHYKLQEIIDDHLMFAFIISTQFEAIKID